MNVNEQMQNKQLINEDNFSTGYQSTDFEFIVSCMALGDHDIRIVEFTRPYSYGDGAKNKDQLIMHLLIYEKGIPMPDTPAIFLRLRRQYQSNTLRVNPRALLENQRTLRAMIIEAKNNMMRRDKRER